MAVRAYLNPVEPFGYGMAQITVHIGQKHLQILPHRVLRYMPFRIYRKKALRPYHIAPAADKGSKLYDIVKKILLCQIPQLFIRFFDGAVRIKVIHDRADTAVLRILHEKVHSLFDGFGLENVIAVRPDQVLSRNLQKPAVDGGRSVLMRGMKDLIAVSLSGKLFSVALRNLQRAVCGSVIHEDHFHPWIGLSKDRIQHELKMTFSVVDRSHAGDKSFPITHFFHLQAHCPLFAQAASFRFPPHI